MFWFQNRIAETTCLIKKFTLAHGFEARMFRIKKSLLGRDLFKGIKWWEYIESSKSE